MNPSVKDTTKSKKFFDKLFDRKKPPIIKNQNNWNYNLKRLVMEKIDDSNPVLDKLPGADIAPDKDTLRQLYSKIVYPRMVEEKNAKPPSTR